MMIGGTMTVLRDTLSGQQLYVEGIYWKEESSAKLHIMCLFTRMDSAGSRLSVIEPPAAPEEWWICAFGLINWSNNQKLDGCGSSISQIAFSVIQYFQSTNVQY